MKTNAAQSEREQGALSPFTGSLSTDVIGKRDGKKIYRCRDTGALFFDRATVAVEHYQDYYPYLRDFDGARFDWELRIRRGKYIGQLRQMERYSPGRRLLDVGAGPGYLCRIASENGWDATGVEVSEEAVAHAKRVFGVNYRRLEDVPEGSIDAITCHHILEHISEPMSFLQTLKSKLSPGGLLVLHVPHQQPLSFMIREKVRKLRASQDDMYCTLYGNIHLSGFTSESLSRLLELAGFQSYFVRTAGMWSMYYDPFFMMNYVRTGSWGNMTRKFLRAAIDKAGGVIGAGDWVIGYFRNSD